MPELFKTNIRKTSGMGGSLLFGNGSISSAPDIYAPFSGEKETPSREPAGVYAAVFGRIRGGPVRESYGNPVRTPAGAGDSGPGRSAEVGTRNRGRHQSAVPDPDGGAKARPAGRQA